MNEGAVTVTPDGILLYCKGHFADLLGRSLVNVIGASLYDVIPMSERANLDALLRQGKTGAGKTELTLIGPRGAISAQLSAMALQVDELEAVCIVVTDLTERRHSEELIASENLARSILEQAPESIVVCDGEGRITRANRSAVELCGQDPVLRQFDDAFPMRRIRHEGRWDPTPVTAISGERETLRSIGAILTRPNLPPVEVLISTYPLSTSDGEPLGRVITLTDISALTRVEQI